MRGRMEVLHRIDDLLEGHCKTCPERPGQDTRNYRRRQRHCSNICEVGIELQELGKQLTQSVEIKRANKEEVDMSKYPHITKELLEAEIKAGKTNKQIEKEQGIPNGALSYWMAKLGVERPKCKTSRSKSSKDKVQKRETVKTTKTPIVEIPVDVNVSSRVTKISETETTDPVQETNYIHSTVERDEQTVKSTEPKKSGRSIQVEVSDCANVVEGELLALAEYIRIAASNDKSYHLEISLVEVNINEAADVANFAMMIADNAERVRDRDQSR